MCGIAGVVSFDGRGPADPRITDALSAALAHRGPDGHGCYRSADGRAALVHRRLAIIDPTVRAAQPMASSDARYHLTFNGEIYNYRSLRDALEQRGCAFRTESDTEVVLSLLAEEGPRALEQLRGMFALALWDERDRTLLVARDRFGMKPLYLAARTGQVAFASEIRALRAAGLVDGTVSSGGILAYLAWASIPAPLTWLEGVEQLEPGTWRSWDGCGTVTAGRFTDVNAPFAGEPERDEAAFRERVADALCDSVRAHLVADVPVGVFLSSGIDSGAVVATVRAVTNANLHAYTVVVDETAYSEEAGARRIAERFGMPHHVLRIDANSIESRLDAIVHALDQPTADAVNTYFVSQAVAATGVKAVLSGIGGDEMFGGYPSFGRIPSGLALSRAIGPLLRLTGAAAGFALPSWRAAKWRHFASDARPESGYRAMRGLFMPEELASLAGPALCDPATWGTATAALDTVEERIFESAGGETPLATVARMETRMFLASQLLRDVDAVSMAHGLEVRMPFVDHHLQRAVWPSLGAYPALASHKRILYEALRLPLPEGITDRPKQGFTLPFEEWLHGPLRDPARAGFDLLVARGWVNPEAANRVWSAWEAGQAHWSRVWALGMLGRFLEQAE